MMNYRAAIASAYERLTEGGFVGRRGLLLFDHDDGDHYIALRRYYFDRAADEIFVELVEKHNGARPARITRLSSLVHVMQNLGEMEMFQIEGRDTPGVPL